ncbi:MAG: FAD-dependent oxidoreductase [Acidimicrobiales bacterium]
MQLEEDFDVIVVGARCAGAPLALDLSRRGLRVGLVDRARFPSEVPSTHMIHPCGIARLARLGLMDKLLATGAPPLVRGTFVVDDVRIEMRPEVAARFEAPWLCIRRRVLDQCLVDAASQAGVTVMSGRAVTGLIEQDGVVRGVRTDDALLRCSLVVGADGMHSTIARLAGAQEYHTTPPGRVFLWGYFHGADAPNGYATLGRIGNLGFIAMPTDSGLYMAGIAISREQRNASLADTSTSLCRGLEGTGEVAEFLRPARRVGPVRVMARWHGYFRQATGPGWVLLGDAGHFKDPTPAQGISDALRQGETLAEVIESGLGDGRLGQRLGEWWRWRDRDAWEMYWFATDMGAAENNPGMVAETLRRIVRQPDGPERFLRVLNHELPPSKLFTLGRVLSTLVTAGAAHPRRLPRLAGETANLATQEITRRRLRRKQRYPNLTHPQPSTSLG